MSYEIVERKSEEIIGSIERSAFGPYAEKIATLIPFATGKIQFRIKQLKVSYSHFSNKAKVDYRLSDRWKLFYNHKENDDQIDDRSGVNYSFRF